MKTRDYKIRVWTRDYKTGTDTGLFAREMRVDIMKTSTVRAVCTREFNKALRDHANTDLIVLAKFDGQDDTPPYTFSSGGLSGVHGRVMRRDGEYEQ